MQSRSARLIVLLLLSPATASAQQIKSRLMVVLDTSGSMGFHFTEPARFCAPNQGCNPDYPGGDGSTAYTGPIGSQVPNWSGQNAFPINIYPGKAINGGRDGVNSRLFAAKAALTDAINAFTGDIDFGFSTYDFQLCPYNSPLCEPCQIVCNMFGQCSYSCLYTNNAFNQLASTNWRSQSCGGAGQGGAILVRPGGASNLKILPWVDGVEVFQDSRDGVMSLGTGGGTPLNPEVRAEGDTPLAEAIATARAGWYSPILTAQPNTASYDPQLNCRPYVLVVETDGGQSYECQVGIRGGPPGAGNPCCAGEHCNQGVCGADPTTAVQNLYNANPNNRVLTYVIGLSIVDPNALAQLNAMAQAGGTGNARLASNQAQIEAAYADILARSVKVEVCNGKDDTCNGLIDEGLGVYQECKANNDCGSGSCSSGRCTCRGNGDCANGYSCSGGFCQPSCSAGVGACLRTGARKCDANQNAACCVNDGQAACTPLVAGPPGPPICKPGVDNNCNGILDLDELACQMNPCNPVPEVCNGLDDDCDGTVDDNLSDAGQRCGLDIGICKAGTTVCVNGRGVDVQKGGMPDRNDHLICQGQVAPQAPQCNGCDNTCIGVVDAPTRACYGGPMGTENAGICHGGVQRCTANVCPQAPAYGPCVGEVLPQAEVCNGLDDDCNGKIDDVAGAGGACCPSMKCGIGICTAGSQQCSGGGLQCIGGQGPRGETCNGLDDDCNGKVDDLPNLGQACAAANGCPGVLTCDPMKMAVGCEPRAMNCAPDCGGDPRIGQPCGAGMGLPPPCMAGIWACVNGLVVCQGGRAPAAEACNCLDDDCNGKVDDDAFCPGGYACYQCACDPPCGAGEFKCMAGLECQDDGQPCKADGDCPPAQLCMPTSKCSGYCVPTGCNPPCADGKVCRNGGCVDPCVDVTCMAGYACQLGNCVDITCRANLSLCHACDNGAGGERCDLTQNPPACVPDRCCGVHCDSPRICNPGDGTCIGTCAGVSCPGGQVCHNGECIPARCANVECPQGQICDPATGMCVRDACKVIRGNCKPGFACCMNACQQDPCTGIACPRGTRCTVNDLDCVPDCQPLPPGEQDLVMPSGGGGLGIGCSVGGGEASSHPLQAAPLWILLVLGALRRRRRSPGDGRWLRRLGAIALLPLAGGCSANPFCLNCDQPGDGSAASGDLGGRDFSGEPSDLPPSSADGGGDGGCSSDVQSDPNNCGRCGHRCEYAQAGGACVAGECRLGQCLQGWYDIDRNPANGCEYPCVPTPPARCMVDQDCPFGLPCQTGLCVKTCKSASDCPAATVCDPDTALCEGEYCDGKDNNCNGTPDEGFDLATDVDHCGACNAACNPPNATAQCRQGMCSILACNPDGKKGRWYDLDRNASDGCEYDCPVDPPGVEVCNGLDDDCNGSIDDHLSDDGKACDDFCPVLAPCIAQSNCQFARSTCHGRCCGVCTEGATACAGGRKVCNPGAGPKLEVCNGVDDNCDGQVDEGFNLKTDPLNCGACGTACNRGVKGGDGNAVWQCTQGACAVATCKPGFGDVDKSPANGCEYACPVNPPSAESCNGKDDDCSGVADDHLVVPNNFCNQVSICAGAKPVCCGGAGWLCNYASVSARIEVTGAQMCQGGQMGANLAFSEALCDGADGNCNGLADESFLNLGKPCSVGVGACQGQSTYACDPKNARQTACPAAASPMAAVDETCNGIDDDCDGQVDERSPAMGATCYNGGAHACKGWLDGAVRVGNVWVYQYEASRVDATANAAGNSAARACSRAGALPWTSVNVNQAAAACAAVKDSAGAAMRLCTAPEWSTACDLGGGGTWSFAANPNVYQAGVCNGFDANVGLAWPGGTGPQCYANQGNGKLFDMSGNVGEWTSTLFVVNNSTYYKARGGTYADYAGGLTCDFDFVVLQPGYANADIGFRCCADHAP